MQVRTPTQTARDSRLNCGEREFYAEVRQRYVLRSERERARKREREKKRGPPPSAVSVYLGPPISGEPGLFPAASGGFVVCSQRQLESSRATRVRQSKGAYAGEDDDADGQEAHRDGCEDLELRL